ncbi:hypothetical protein M0811_00047 [Anaeramoeba ignava]|uniref:Uncharacterized protein n=1 Tax=Anaeramoeba ignava TaxID=1746090 RepID=A0A9Q0LT00_ANAIG|nr:hypothetical protein M0811_00047 [Anaeramoeba ignava]
MTNWDHYTPSAEYSGTWELYLGSSLYWGIFIFGLVVLIFAWRFKTKLKDNSIFFFPFASLLMLELFALFRALFVLVNIDWKLFGLAFFFYYTAPMACHFCAFSLFLLFLLGLIYYDPANQRIHRRVRILIHILMVASFITIIIMSAFSTEDNYTLLLYIISFILYAILSIIFLNCWTQVVYLAFAIAKEENNQA